MSQNYRTILLFGPPGSGKGTQGSILSCIPGFVHLATGDIFRSLDKETDLGKQFLEYSSRGDLVPDELTIGIWTRHVEGMIDAGAYRPERDLLVLDGIPRSQGQAEAMRHLIDVLAIVQLTVPDYEELVQRMIRRAEQESRHDDADEAVIRKRFEVFEQETAPVLQSYDASLVRKVPASGTPGEVLLRVLEAIVPLQKEHFGNALAPDAVQPG